jgi:Utp11 protein
MRNAVARRPHKERAQPKAREKWGILEKHKVNPIISHASSLPLLSSSNRLEPLLAHKTNHSCHDSVGLQPPRTRLRRQKGQARRPLAESAEQERG